MEEEHDVQVEKSRAQDNANDKEARVANKMETQGIRQSERLKKNITATTIERTEKWLKKEI